MSITAETPLWQGIEVEYAISAGAQTEEAVGPVAFFTALRNAWIGDRPACIYSKDLAAFLLNGGKAYVDRLGESEVLELCTPECPDAASAVAQERALDEYVKLAYRILADNGRRPPHVYRAALAYNRWGRPTTRGLHESYLIQADSFDRCLGSLIPLLVIRPLFCGSGGYRNGSFVVSPRQFFVKNVVSARIPRDHPFIALGKESLAAPQYGRLHICSGESVRADPAGHLRQVTTAWAVRCADLGLLREAPPALRDPVRQAQRLAGNPAQDWVLALADGGRIGAIEYLRRFYLPPIEALIWRRGNQPTELADLALLQDVLAKLERRDFTALNRTLEWCIKYELFEENRGKYFDLDDDGMSGDVSQTLDFQYRAITDPFYEEIESDLPITRVTDSSTLVRAVVQPPPHSRAAARVAVATAVDQKVAAMDWDFVTLHDGRRLEMGVLDGWDADQAVSWAIDQRVAL